MVIPSIFALMKKISFFCENLTFFSGTDLLYYSNGNMKTSLMPISFRTIQLITLGLSHIIQLSQLLVFHDFSLHSLVLIITY